MTRERLRILVFGGLAALFAVTIAFSPRGIVGAMLFLAVVALVCIWFFRFAPYGDLWASADDRGMNPWKLVVLVVILAVAWGAFRLGLVVAGG